MALSKRQRRKRTAPSDRRRVNMSHLVGSRDERGGHRGCQTLPAFGLFAKPPPAGRRHGVVLGFPLVIALTPFRRDESLMFQPVERGIQGALRDLQRVAGYLLNPEQNAVPVQRLQ